MPRGGRRSGKPGAKYPNRSDLSQPVRTVPGQVYGAQTQQQEAQKAIPLPRSAPVQSSPAPTPFVPPEPGMLHAPSTRPGEPVTAGLPMGAGAGPEAMGAVGAYEDQVLANMYEAYRIAPNEGLRALIEHTERSRGIGR